MVTAGGLSPTKCTMWLCCFCVRAWIWVSNLCVSPAPRYFIALLWFCSPLKKLTDSCETQFFSHLKRRQLPPAALSFESVTQILFIDLYYLLTLVKCIYSYTLVPVPVLFSLNNSSLAVIFPPSTENLLQDFVIQAVPVYFRQICDLFPFPLHAAFQFLISR